MRSLSQCRVTLLHIWKVYLMCGGVKQEVGNSDSRVSMDGDSTKRVIGNRRSCGTVTHMGEHLMLCIVVMKGEKYYKCKMYSMTLASRVVTLSRYDSHTQSKHGVPLFPCPATLGSNAHLHILVPQSPFSSMEHRPTFSKLISSRWCQYLFPLLRCNAGVDRVFDWRT